MIFYDTDNYKNTKAKGMLYISLMDVDYLIEKYGLDDLKKDIPNDYIDYMDEELKKISDRDLLDISYYGALQMGIETEKDENLLELIRKEVQNGNLFPKKQLKKLSKDELETLIQELIKQDELTDEDLYKLRSYQMAVYIIDQITRAHDMQISGYTEGGFDVKKYKTIISNLDAIGLNSNIKESTYFDIEGINKAK